MAQYPRSRVITNARAVVGLACLLAGCVNPPSDVVVNGRLRVVNLITDPQRQPVNANLNGANFGTAVPFGAATPAWMTAPLTANYAPVASGELPLTLKWSVDTTVVVGVYVVNVFGNQDRTAYATGGGGFTLHESADDNSLPGAGMVRLRVVNLSTIAGPVEVFLTDQTGDLATATPATVTVGFAQASTYFEVPTNSYRMRAVRSGVAPDARSANVVANVNSQSWLGGVRTILIADAPSPGGGVGSLGIILTDQ